MRIFALIPTLAALVTVVAGAASRVNTGCGLEIGREDVESHIALSTGPPGTVIRYRGTIEVLDSKNKRLGYISKNLNKGGELKYDPSGANALIVTFTTDPKTGSIQLGLTATNMNPPYTFLALIQGYVNTGSDLKPSDWQYLNIGGIKAPGTLPGATPSTIDNSCKDATGRDLTVESAVWKYDTASQLLTPQWINTDRSFPSEDLFAANKDAVLYVGGSKDAFYANFQIPVTTIKFRFVAA